MPAAWGEITAEEIVTPIKGIWVSGKKQTRLAGLSTDSRRIAPGELFWALKGERYDGHDYVQKAIEQGAVGIVVQKDYPQQISDAKDSVIIAVDDSLKAFGDLAGWWRHQHNVRVAAITGSAGKTTTKEMVGDILEIGNRTLTTQGNLNNLIGLPMSLLRLEKEHQNAVLEMGMNCPGEIARLTEIADPDVGVITNVGAAHLEGLGDLEGVAKAKVELIEKISSRGRIVLNGDDKLLMETAAPYQREVVTFGLGRKNDVCGTRVQNLGREGVSFHLQYQGHSWAARLGIPGLHNVSNALAAAAVCLCLNEPPEHIVEGLGSFAGVKGRFELSPLPGGIILADDTYNANPSSLKAALDSVKALVDRGGRIIVGLGEMMELGDAAITAHQEAGRMVAEIGVQYFLVMGEHALEMAKGAVESGLHRSKVEVVKSHSEMVRRIRKKMKQGDLIFLKGSRKVALEKVVDGLRGGYH